MADPAVSDPDAVESIEVSPCQITSGAETLAGWFVTPVDPRHSIGVVLAHGFQSSTGASLTGPMKSLAERIAGSMGVSALAFGCRGIGESTGDFSITGWLNDLVAGIDFVAAHDGIDNVAIVGFGTGGALGVCAAEQRPALALTAALGAPADFDDWANNPRELLLYGRELGVIGPDAFDDDFDEWASGLPALKAVASAEHLDGRPLLVMHGSEDDVVPPLDARAIADGHGAADLRIISGSGHHLRHDPRAMAVLLGWLDRQIHDLGADDQLSSERKPGSTQ